MRLIASSALFTDYDAFGPTEVTGMAIYVDPDVLTTEVEAKAREALHAELRHVRSEKLAARDFSGYRRTDMNNGE